MAAAAKGFLDNLTEEQKAKAVYKLTDAEREHWIYVPQPFAGEGMRKGLTIKDMRPDQRHLAYALLSTGLSHRGYTTALQIMSLEQVLWELENNAPKQDTQMYYITIFGEPVDLSRWKGKPLTAKTLAEATTAVMQAITALVEELRDEKAPVERWDPSKHGQTEIGRF